MLAVAEGVSPGGHRMPIFHRIEKSAMRIAQTRLSIETAPREIKEITAEVARWVGNQPIAIGLLTVYLPHTSASLLIQENASPDVLRDLDTFRAALAQLALPAISLGIFSLAPIARMTRASMLAILSSDFVRTARASGLTPRTVIVTYAFRNAMLPVITTLGMVFSFLLGANVLVEKVFAWPGVGSYAVEALIASDYAPVQGFVLAMAILYVLLNLAIDIAYGLIDPRVRLEG